MRPACYFVHSEAYKQYKFNDEHPFNQKRLDLTLDLMQKYELIKPNQFVEPRYATTEELELIHDPNYIEAVKKCGESEKLPIIAASYGLGTEDTPAFPGMHEATSLIVGGTLRAAELVMSGECDHAVNLAGGLHHGFRGRASGFCVYNDCSVVIAYLRKHYDAKVLYIDTDAHHGDGVQWAFYDDPHVLTVSFHETGKYLFPGTGKIFERGDGQGFGYSINVPFEPFTEDESWLDVYEQVLSEAARGFKPDVIVTQNGCDSHFLDPLTHLSCSMEIYRQIPKLAHRLAHELCDGRLIATGGGGYDIWRVVPRAWTLLWAELSDQGFSDNPAIPSEWIDRWQADSPVQLPPFMFEAEDVLPDIPRRPEITSKNKLYIEKALLHAPK
ncbi:histone deacetylase [Ammoniphilus oxalaticus]|uniref:Acetoin utilization protein AcuC n=1 Tax=Ammoniphilus oxalaticus TaxID=66863 RepID=A0A419SRG9_9BACL|nr:acetoin utilization protein AcuC [Ammoniphilus oxalaticus]RKD27021.1 histone deacetylase [Ammoniphilus oxalaticus]